MVKNNSKNDKYCGKVVFLTYTERVKFSSQRRKATSKTKPKEDRGLGSISRDKSNVIH